MFETTWNILEENCKDIHMEGIHPVIRKVLSHKGIREITEIQEFLSLKPQKTYDPYLMKNMKEVVDLILFHIQERKNIWIYGDYDVDGVTSTALLISFLGNFTDKLNYYIPSRAEEGYGLNCEAISEIKRQGAELVITVDCGSTSVKEIELAKELGMDIIITDHHNLSGDVPDCLILNPKQKDCSYPFKGLCGCGITFKLAQALQKSLNAPKRYLNDLLDLVALATVADVVPLLDENRTLLKYGLKNMNSVTRPGLKYLIEAINLNDKEINSTHIGFVLAPYFNASGRIDDARAGVELLITLEEEKIKALAAHLIRCNHERKHVQEEGLKICKQKTEELYSEDLFLVIDSDGVHEGVIGIIAGRIRDLYYRPTLIITESSEEGVLKGSGRGIEGIDIYEEMKKCADLLIKFGGHKNACGFSIRQEKLTSLRIRLNEQMKAVMNDNPEVFTKKINIYAELKPEEVTEQLIGELKRIEPYGMGNEKPYFLVRLKDGTEAQKMGKNQEHLKLQGSSSSCYQGRKFQAVGFGMAELYIERLGSPALVDLVGFPNINEWNGYKNIQFLIQDMKSNIS